MKTREPLVWPGPTLMGALLLINKERKTCYHGDGNQNKLVQEHAGHMYLPSPYSSKKQLLKKTRLRSVLRASTAVTITLQKKKHTDKTIKLKSFQTKHKNKHNHKHPKKVGLAWERVRVKLNWGLYRQCCYCSMSSVSLSTSVCNNCSQITNC